MSRADVSWQDPVYMSPQLAAKILPLLWEGRGSNQEQNCFQTVFSLTLFFMRFLRPLSVALQMAVA